MKRGLTAFTLAEVLIAMAVLAMLVLLMTRLFNSAASITTSGNKRMDADAQSRALLDRIAVDIAQMVKRSDVDYYLKSSANSQNGNDQMAFYSSVPGYYPSTGSQSPISVVAYRINAQSKFERMAKGLLWNGVSPSSTPIVFLPSIISGNWAAATNASLDSDYELIGPYVFRFEYYYLLKNGALSDTPWDTGIGHTNVNGMADVAAICVSLATLEPKSRILISDAQLTALTGHLNDFASSMKPGDLLAQWQATLNTVTDMPRPVLSAVRMYERYFSLAPKQ